MKILSWNCSRLSHDKLQPIIEGNFDICILYECEERILKELSEIYPCYLWKKSDSKLGIGVLAKDGIKLDELGWDSEGAFLSQTGDLFQRYTTSDLQSFLPFIINDKCSFLAIWTKGLSNSPFGYIGQFWKFLEIHIDDISKSNPIICGDLNSNAIWDQNDRWWNHSDVISKLKGIGYKSIYHEKYNELQGQESTPTYFRYKNISKGYHIDYLFARDHDIKNFAIGNPEKWLKFSDHMPFIYEI